VIKVPPNRKTNQEIKLAKQKQNIVVVIIVLRGDKLNERGSILAERMEEPLKVEKKKLVCFKDEKQKDRYKIKIVHEGPAWADKKETNKT